MDEAPSGVMTDMKADDRPAPGEVRGKPADETNEAPSSPVLRPSGSQSPNGSRIIDIEGEEDEEEDYDDIPDPAVSVSNRPTTMRSMMTSLTTMTISLLPTVP